MATVTSATTTKRVVDPDNSHTASPIPATAHQTKASFSVSDDQSTIDGSTVTAMPAKIAKGGRSARQSDGGGQCSRPCTRDRDEELPCEQRATGHDEDPCEWPEEGSRVLEELVLVRLPPRRLAVGPVIGEVEEEAVVREQRSVVHDVDADGDDDPYSQSDDEHSQDRVLHRPVPRAAEVRAHSRSYAG